MFPVLLHADLYRRLHRLNRTEQARVWKTLGRLREGRWSGGTRVKRLRGVARPVFEARSDDGDRLLFTLARAASPSEPDRLVTHLQVWDFVAHDDAVRVARRNQAPEAEFLELESLEEMAIDEPPPHPEATFDDLVLDPDEEPLLQYLFPAVPPSITDADAITGGIRWLTLEGASPEAEELALQLTAEQYRALTAPDPLLLSGSAGSGKTTLAAWRLAAAALAEPAPRTLYLTYSPALVSYTRELVQGLVLARGGDPERNPPLYATFDELFASLVPHEEGAHRARPMTEPRFRAWLNKAGRPLDAALVWEELRSILKGACLDLGQPMLDEAAYYELGRKRAPLFVAQRPDIYRIARRYQEWLAEERRTDRIDLCRRAFAELRKGKSRRFDVVVVDEVQDLTELEVAFVLALARRPGLAGVLLTGDAQQMVNPSGFRWAEVRRLAAKAGRLRSAPPVVRLRRNLRSVRPVVELGNALVGLRKEVFGRSEDDELEDAVLAGPVPVLASGTEDAVCQALAGFGPRAAVLVATDEEAERLRLRLGTSRVLTVRETKGLEIEAAVLWRLLLPDRDLVERLGRGDARLESEPRFERLLHHLYVAVTRARRHLAIYEGDEGEIFWRHPRFVRHLEPAAPETLSAVFRVTASPGEWAAQGEAFLAHGSFLQAAECFRRGARPEREAEALARFAEREEDWSEALALRRKLGQGEHEAPLLERLGRWEEAAALHRRAGREDEAGHCELRAQEQQGRFQEAAEGWESLGRFDEAARCFARAGDSRRALLARARAAETEDAGSAGRDERVARLYEEAGFGEEAVALYAQAGCWQEVARLESVGPEEGLRLLGHLRGLVEQGDWEQALALVEARREALRSRLPQVPWFVFVEAQRLAWQESCSLDLLELRCRALSAESARAWSRAARLWQRAGDAARAMAARRERVALIRDPDRRERIARGLASRDAPAEKS